MLLFEEQLEWCFLTGEGRNIAPLSPNEHLLFGHWKIKEEPKGSAAVAAEISEKERSKPEATCILNQRMCISLCN